ETGRHHARGGEFGLRLCLWAGTAGYCHGVAWHQEAEPPPHGVRRSGCRGDRAGEGLLRAISAFLSPDRALQGRQTGVHARTEEHRRPDPHGYRGGSQRRVRPVLRLMDDGAKKLIVVGDRVLILPQEGEERTNVGLYLPATALEGRQVQGGRIVATGPGSPMAEPWATLAPSPRCAHPVPAGPRAPWREDRARRWCVPRLPAGGSAPGHRRR